MSVVEDEALRALLAEESTQVGCDPVAAASIRMWCAAAEDPTPRYWLDSEDPRLAVPPAMVPTLLSRTPWQPGGQPQRGMELHHRLKAELGLSTAVVREISTWFGAPVRIGDRLNATYRILRLEQERPSSMGRGRDWSIVAVFRNQRGELVAVVTWTFHGYRPAAGASTASHGRNRTTTGRHIDSVPALEVDIDTTRIIMAAAASSDWTRFHHDPAYAAGIGMPDIILNTHGHAALVSRWASNVVAPGSRLLRLTLRMRKPVVPGDRLSIGAESKKVVDLADGQLVELGLVERVGAKVVATGEVATVMSSDDDARPWQIPLADWHGIADPGAPAHH